MHYLATIDSSLCLVIVLLLGLAKLTKSLVYYLTRLSVCSIFDVAVNITFCEINHHIDHHHHHHTQATFIMMMRMIQITRR